MYGGRPTYISSATTTQVFSGPCVIDRVVITETAAGAISIYDATSGTSNPVAVFKASIVEGSYELGARVSNGVRVVTAGASKLTVICSPQS